MVYTHPLSTVFGPSLRQNLYILSLQKLVWAHGGQPEGERLSEI